MGAAGRARAAGGGGAPGGGGAEDGAAAALSGLTVAALKVELQARGLATAGRKADLVARLAEAKAGPGTAPAGMGAREEVPKRKREPEDGALGGGGRGGSSGAELQAKADRIRVELQQLYPEGSRPIPLDHGSRFQFLCAVVLSAQSTDKKVNQISPALFAAGPTPAAMAALGEGRIRELIREIGLAPSKAKYLANLSEALVREHGGEVPGTFEDLEKLSGVGHKTASVVMSQAFGVPAFPVDTHIHRLAARWGLSDGSSVVRTEADLKRLFPESSWNALHLQIIFYGREHGKANQKPPWPGPICAWAGLDDPPGTTPAKKRAKAQKSAKAGGKGARRKL